MMRANMEAVLRALEAAGIKFIPEKGGGAVVADAEGTATSTSNWQPEMPGSRRANPCHEILSWAHH
jgi:hypothetical protein